MNTGYLHEIYTRLGIQNKTGDDFETWATEASKNDNYIDTMFQKLNIKKITGDDLDTWRKQAWGLGPSGQPPPPVFDGEHINEDEFMDLSKTKGFTPFGIDIKKGREETIIPRLEEIYGFDKNGKPTGFKFEESGVQDRKYGGKGINAVKITLPDGITTRVFTLPSGNRKPAEVKEAYTNITKYIESQYKREIAPGAEEDLGLIISGDYEDPYEEEVDKTGQVIEDVVARKTFGLSKESREKKIARQINDLFGADGVTAETKNLLRGAIEIKLPNGSKRLFNINPNNENVTDQILHFIKSNPGNVEETDSYQKAIESLNNEIEPFLRDYLNDPNIGIKLASNKERNRIKRKIKQELDIRGHKLLLNKSLGLLTDDITPAQQDKMIDQSIDEVLRLAYENKFDNDSNIYFKNEKRDKKLTYEEITDGLFDKAYNSHSDLNKKIIDLYQELDNPDITEERKKDILGDGTEENPGLLAGYYTLKESEEKREYNDRLFVDLNTMERKLNKTDDDDYNIYDITNLVDKNIEEIKNLSLTRAELKDNWVVSASAYHQQVHTWNNDKRLFHISGTSDLQDIKDKIARIETFRGGEGQVEWRRYDKDWNLVPQGSVIGDKRTHYNYALYMTDATATKYFMGKNSRSKFFDKKSNIGYQGRFEYQLKTDANYEAYNKMYLLNDDVFAQKKGHIRSAEGRRALAGQFVDHVAESFAGRRYQLKHGTNDEMLRQTFLDAYYDLGVVPTHKEKEYVKESGWETATGVTAETPKLLLDFAIAGAVTSGVGGVIGLTRLVRSLKAGHYAINTAKGVKVVTRTQLATHIKKINPRWYKGFKPGTAAYHARTAKWVGKNISKDKKAWLNAGKLKSGKPRKTINSHGYETKSPLLKRGGAALINAQVEGIKMEIAMRDPLSGFQGEGGGYATGVGFGLAGSLIPWPNLFKGVKKGTGGYRGLYDYAVKAPINFTIGAKFGQFSQAIVDDLRGTKTWSNFLEENYSDWDEIGKHVITDLWMGFTMRMSHFNRYDFRSHDRISELRNKATAKRESYYEKYKKDQTIIIDGKEIEVKKGDNIVEERTVEGVSMLGRLTTKKELGPKFARKKYEKNQTIVVNGKKREVKKGETVLDKKGKPTKEKYTEKDVEKQQTLINLANQRMALITNTQEDLDPFLGQVKLHRQLGPTLKELNPGNKRDVSIRYDFEQKQNMTFSIVPTEGIRKDGKTSKKETIEFVFNPYLLNPGLAPHELGHAGLRILFGRDVMFKGEFINGLKGILQQIKIINKEGKEVSVYKQMMADKVWTPGARGRFEYEKIKEEELLWYAAEYLAKEGNLVKLEKAKIFEQLSGLIQKTLNNKLKTNTNLNTQKEIVQWMSGYIKTIKKVESGVGSLKHLEKFISPIKTKRQAERRKKWEEDFRKKHPGERIPGESYSSRSNTLQAEIADLKKELKTGPYLQQLKDNEITADEYKVKTQELRNNIEIKEKALKNIVKDQPVFESKKDLDAFEKEVDKTYTTSTKEMRSWDVAKLYDPRTQSNAGAARLATELYKYSGRANFSIHKGEIIDDILTGAGKPKKRGEGMTKARSIRQMVLDYKPGMKDKEGNKIPLSGYIGSTLWGKPGVKGRGILETIDYFLPPAGVRRVAE